MRLDLAQPNSDEQLPKGRLHPVFVGRLMTALAATHDAALQMINTSITHLTNSRADVRSLIDV